MAIGVGLRDNIDDIYAISIPVPSQRFNDKRDTLVTALRVTLNKVQALL